MRSTVLSTGAETPEWLKVHRPQRYWFRIFSAERRVAREAAAKAERLAAIPQPVRYAAEGDPVEFVAPVKNRTKADSKRLMRRIWEAQGRRCYLCIREIAFDCVTVEHVTPRAKGGTNTLNRMASCARCNLRKGSRAPYACETLWLSHINLTVVRRGSRTFVRPGSKELAKRAAFATAMEEARRARVAREAASSQAAHPAPSSEPQEAAA